MERKLTPSLKDYLQAIYAVQSEDGLVHVTDIADVMGVTKPSVCRAAQLLEDKGYLLRMSYGPLRLTALGRSTAVELADRRKILCHFLVQTLGLSEEAAIADACGMEHVVSNELLAKMAETLCIRGEVKYRRRA